jgi:hypothetical protein
MVHVSFTSKTGAGVGLLVGAIVGFAYIFKTFQKLEMA